MLRTLYLYGKLRKKCGVDKITLVGESVADLIKGLSANFSKELKPSVTNPRLICRVRGFDSEEDLYRPLHEDETEIHLYPTLIGGGGGGGLFKIILGAVLIVIGIALLVYSGVAGPLGILGLMFINAGAGLMLGGLIEMLMPQPKPSDPQDASRYLGAQGNTVKIGTPVPILMGRFKVFGQYLSFNVDAKDRPGGGGGGGGDGGGDDGGGVIGGPNTAFIYSTTAPSGAPRNFNAVWLDTDSSPVMHPAEWDGTSSWATTGTWDSTEHCWSVQFPAATAPTRVYVQTTDLPASITGGAQNGYYSVNSSTLVAQVFVVLATGGVWLPVETISITGGGGDGGGGGDDGGNVGSLNTFMILANDPPGNPLNGYALWCDKDSTSHVYQPYEYNAGYWVVPNTCAWDTTDQCWSYTPLGTTNANRLYVVTTDVPSLVTGGPQEGFICVNKTTNQTRVYHTATSSWVLVETVSV